MIRGSFRSFGIGVIVPAMVLTTRLSASGPLPPSGWSEQHGSHAESNSSSSRLAEKVRDATEIFRDVQQAIDADYEQFGGCVSGPEEGAMGVHFVNSALVDGELDLKHPEALIYEMKNGRARLVGVEYIVPAEAWDSTHTEPRVPPVLEGQLFHFNDSPNRYRLPAFYELHVWAWRENPKGTFVDWNTRVSCDGQ
jgi:hypothetical protein